MEKDRSLTIQDGEIVNLTDEELGRMQPIATAMTELLEHFKSMDKGWQPIETAPIDGTRVLVSDKYGDIKICWFESGWGWNSDFSDLEDFQEHPVAWMPLPKPPVKKNV